VANRLMLPSEDMVTGKPKTSEADVNKHH